MSSALDNTGVKAANGTSAYVQNNLHAAKDQYFTIKMFFEGKSMVEFNTPFIRIIIDNFILTFIDSALVRQLKERHIIRQVSGVAESHPAEALLGGRCAVIYKKISCLKSIGGLTPSGIQNKLI